MTGLVRRFVDIGLPALAGPPGPCIFMRRGVTAPGCFRSDGVHAIIKSSSLLAVILAAALFGCSSGPSPAAPGGGSADAAAGIALRVVTYNIRHGRGMDGVVDLARTARVLDSLGPDLIGLQEVDWHAARSGGVDQAAELGRLLGMHAVFEPFMDFQGGKYGMAVLSRHPFGAVRSLHLPDGHEPRVALVAEVLLPDGQTITVVNVHFDWVDDDAYRHAQAAVVAEYLRGLRTPFVLLGDFNDQPGSRTLDLFHAIASEAIKPRDDRLTFSSIDPSIEIDFILMGPGARWTHRQVRVHDEPDASDHRPVSTLLILHPEE